METTKKLNETPLIQEMTADHTYVIVDSQGNVSRMNDVPKKYVTETELTDFIKPYDERITANKTDIENVKTDALDLETYIDTITPKNTASGEIAHTTDALPLPTFGTKSGGNVEQFTTTGKNLANDNEFKGAIIGGNRSLPNITVNENEVFSITLSQTLKEIGTIGSNNDYIAQHNLKWLDENKNVISQNNFLMMTFSSIGETKILSSSGYVAPTGAKYLKLDVGSYFSNGCKLIHNYIQVEKNTEVTDYEPFTNGASPNPEYPQEIEVLEGYNLFDKNNANVIDGYILDTSATKIEASSYGKIIYIKCEPNTSYSISKLANRFFMASSSEIPQVEKNIENVVNAKDSSNKYENYVTSANAKYLILYCYYSLNASISFEEMLDSIQIVKGKEVNPYLPYGCVGYKVNGKNLLNLDVPQILNVTYNDDGTITLNGKGNNNLWYNRIWFKTNKKYYVKVELVSGEITGVNNSGIMNPPGTNFLQLNTFNEFSFTEDTSKQTMWTHAQAVYNNARLKIWISDEQTDFEPYKEQIVPLDLKGNWVGKINDTIKDYLVTDKKKYWLVKNVGKVILNGSENWSLRTEQTKDNYNTAFFSLPISNIKLNGKELSTHFRFRYLWDSDVEGVWVGGSSDLNIRISKTIASTVAEFKKWLSENNVTVYYDVKTPEIIELGELPEPIKTFEGVNNIQLLANLDTEIEVVYAQDVKKYIDSKLAEISAQII